MTTREDAELEACYKSGHQHSHAAGLREVYQAGRADEALALAPKSGDAATGAKRPIVHPGTPGPGTVTDGGAPTPHTGQAGIGPPGGGAANQGPAVPAVDLSGGQNAQEAEANTQLENAPERDARGLEAENPPKAPPAELIGDGSDVPVVNDEVAYSDQGPTTKKVRPAKANIPSTPNPGTDPPGGPHPAANPGG